MNRIADLHKIKILKKYGLVVLVLYLSVFYGALMTLDSREASLASDIISPLGSILSLIFISRAIKYHSFNKAKIIWIYFFLGISIFLLGDIRWACNQICGKATPYPSDAEIFYIISALFILIGFFLFIPKKSRISAKRSGFDVLILMVVYFSLEIEYIVIPELSYQTLNTLEKLTSLMYPLFDAALFVAVLFIYFNEAVDRRRFSSGLLPLIAIIIMVIDEIYNIQSILGTFQPNSWLIPIWPASFLLLAYVSLESAQFYLSPGESVAILDENSNDATIKHRIYFTYFSLLIFVTVWCVDFWKLDPISIGGIIIGVLVIFRQFYSRLENRRLLKLLITSNEDLKEANSRIEYELKTDYLTRLFNRRYIDRALSALQKSAAEYPTPFSVLVLDIDHFKNINDLYGHSSGDQVLKQLADLIKANIRMHDIAGRWGGEEFIVLLPDTDERLAYSIAERIRSEIEHYAFRIDAVRENVSITVSIGISEWDPSEYDFSRVLLRADQGMYEAKAAGRNRTMIKKAASPPTSSY